MKMSEVVKKEVEDGELAKTTPDADSKTKSGGGGGEEDATLTHLSLSPATSLRPKLKLTFPSARQQRNPTEKTGGKRIKIKKRHSDSKFNCKVNKPQNDGGDSCPGVTKSSALVRAEEVQSNLEPEFPSFVKSLVRSHVASCFWMGLPGPFCRAHLPREDTTVTLEDEGGGGFRMKYIAHKRGLSAGWRQFSVAHQLLEGDVLVFQLVGPCIFKVYIIRANDMTDMDGALVLLNLEAQIKQNDTELAMVTSRSTKKKRHWSLSLAIVQKKYKKSRQPRSSSVPKNGQSAEQYDSEEVGSEVLEGSKLLLPAVQFNDIKSFENFNVLVDGLVIDSELSENIRSKYYKLCCSQRAFLHKNLIKGMNFKLIAGIISETANIADAIRACNLTTSRDEFATWDKTLEGCDLFGMNVGFLRERLSRLVSLAYDSEVATKTKRYIEARNERERITEEIRDIELKLVELKAANETFSADIESLKSKAEIYELKFQEEVLAPW